MSYSPRSGSVADRAHQFLTARGKLSGAALADAIDHDGVPLASVEHEPDEHPPVQRVVPASSRPKAEPPRACKPAAAPLKPAEKAPATAVQTPATADAVRFTIERELRLVIEHGGQRLVLNKDDVGRLREMIEEAAS